MGCFVMSTEFLITIKRLEGFIARSKWEQAEAELRTAYTIQPENPYLPAFNERIATLAGGLQTALNSSSTRLPGR
jgi:hypothetical protein